MLPSLTLILFALLPTAAPSLFLGGQMAASNRWGNSPQLVGGVRVGHWDGWVSAELSSQFHQHPFDTIRGASGWGDGYGTIELLECFRAGAEWGARDSGVGQTLGGQFVFFRFDDKGMRGPTRYTSLDLLWGIRWVGEGLEAGASFGPSITMIHPRDYDFLVSLSPILNLRLAKIW